MKKLALRISIALTLLLFVLLLAADSSPKPQRKPKPVVKRVATTRVETVHAARAPQFSGTLRAARRANLAFTLSGRLETRLVEIGDIVEEGQVLARIDRKPLRNAVSSTEARLQDLISRSNQGERDVKRVRELVAARAATREELEKMEAAFQSLKANKNGAETALEEARRMLREAQLIAPFKGVVTAVHMESGEFTNAGRPVVSLGGLNELELEVEVQESLLKFLDANGRVSLKLPFSEDRQVGGYIKSLGRSTGGQGRLFPILISVDREPGLYAGMTANLELNLPAEKELAIPIASVINPGGSRPSVYRLEENKVHRIEVEVGRLMGDSVTVFGELKEGDAIVTGGFSGLSDGEVVEVLR